MDDADTCFTGAGNSFDLTDVRLYANMHTIDSALANSYASHVLRGNPLTVHFSSVVGSRHLVNGSSFDINLVRGLSRLKQSLIVVVQAAGEKVADFVSPFNQVYDTDTDGFQWQLSIGSRRWPETPCQGIAQSWMRFRQAAGSFYGSSDHSITATQYATNTFILGCNLEKVDTQASHSGFSTKDGSIVQLSIQNSGLSASDHCFIFQVYDSLLEIRDGSCSVYE